MDVDDIFSLILINCNIILETKAKYNHTIIKMLDTAFLQILSFIFYVFFELICHVEIEVSLMFNLLSQKKIYIVIACCTCNKKCWFLAALLTSY